MMALVKLAALVSVGRNPVSGMARAARNDILAMDAACALGPEISVLHAGDPTAEVLLDYLAYGAANIEVIALPAGTDVLSPLAARLADFGLIVCGQRAEAGESSGMLPYLLARVLHIPVVTAALELTLLDGEVEILQFLPKGKRRVLRVTLPVIVALHPRAPRNPRYAYGRRRAGL